VSAPYVHGGTDAREVARLEKQGDWTAAFAFDGFEAPPGARVLDLACGVGAMSARLARAFERLRLVGLDLSAQQLAACRRAHPEVPVLRALATCMPFASGTFDRVFCSWLLEHVPRPTDVLREVFRVLKPAGVCQFVEVDNWSLVTRPMLPATHALLRALNAAQGRALGDPAIGPRLFHHARAAGFRRFTLEPVRLHATSAQPAFLSAFIDEFAEIFESLDESLGPGSAPLIAEAVAELRAVARQAGVALTYTPWRLRAERPAGPGHAGAWPAGQGPAR
jgi:SAM-dependent methyltransferase